jgi:cytochrome b6-f complex iron-sulfur subunit
MHRRAFLSRSVSTGCAVGACALRVVALPGLLATSAGCSEPTRGRITAGTTADFPLGTRTLLRAEKLFILHLADGFAAVSAVCTHQGCIVQPREGADGFQCPCHGAIFDGLGAPTSGPAPSALTWYTLSVESDQVVIDLDAPTSAGTFTKP